VKALFGEIWSYHKEVPANGWQCGQRIIELGGKTHVVWWETKRTGDAGRRGDKFWVGVSDRKEGMTMKMVRLVISVHVNPSNHFETTTNGGRKEEWLIWICRLMNCFPIQGV